MDKRITRAVNEGNVYAMLAMAYSYHYGIDTGQDPLKAVQWYKRSASNGCARAKWELAKLYRDGELVEQNSYEYVHWLSSAADAGVPDAMFRISLDYYIGILVPKDDYLFIEWLKKAAESGFSLAEFYLGHAYEHGIVVRHDLHAAEALYQKVQAHSDADLMYEIGRRCEFGLDGITSDLNDAVRWYGCAANMGSDKAYYSLCCVNMVIDGKKAQQEISKRDMNIQRLPSSVDTDQRERLIAEADEEMELGDFDAAVRKYRESADLGNPEAMYMVAILYHAGKPVRRDDALAFEYLTRAAISGCADAAMHLALAYENGIGREKDLDEAKKYYAVSVANGNLIGYFELSRFMPHPERFVRATQKVVR